MTVEKTGVGQLIGSVASGSVVISVLRRKEE